MSSARSSAKTRYANSRAVEAPASQSIQVMRAPRDRIARACRSRQANRGSAR
ncbi:hypothetical protein OH687_00990 [Burkholderia anthina]|nr:hypothetical protein OH687_00990 [Burkholderia anthina]